jgi:UDPglucose 6-dehydrogenase
MKMVVDLKYVLAVARDCGKHINDYLLVVTKKHGSCRYSKVKHALQEELIKEM